MMLRNREPQAHRPMPWLTIIAGMAFVCTLFAGQAHAATADKPATPPQQRE